MLLPQALKQRAFKLKTTPHTHTPSFVDMQRIGDGRIYTPFDLYFYAAIGTFEHKLFIRPRPGFHSTHLCCWWCRRCCRFVFSLFLFSFSWTTSYGDDADGADDDEVSCFDRVIWHTHTYRLWICFGLESFCCMSALWLGGDSDE